MPYRRIVITRQNSQCLSVPDPVNAIEMNSSVGNSTNTSWPERMEFPTRRKFTQNQVVFRSVIAAIALLVNAFVPAVIGCSRQLHYPRHIFWIAISIVNQFYVIGQLMEVIAMVDRLHIACQISTLFAGAHYTVLLLFLTLAALDRYLAVSHYEWYKTKATNRRTVFVLAFTFVLTYIVITSPFWTGTKTISACTVNFTHMHWVLVFDCVLGVICVTLYVMTFVRSRRAIRQHRPAFHHKSIALRFIQDSFIDSGADPGHRQEAMESVGERNHEPQRNMKITVVKTQRHRHSRANQNLEAEETTECFHWLQTRGKLSRLEIRAALNISFNILPVCLCTFPVSLNGIALYWCFRYKYDCSFVRQFNRYLSDVFIVQTVYNPLMYMFCSTEFQRAFLHTLLKLKPNTKN